MNTISPITIDATTLDVATGTGIFVRALAASGCKSVTGVDATKEMLDRANETKCTISSITPLYLQCDAASLPFPSDSFDIVTIRLAIHHFAEPQIQLREMARVCKPGGKVIIVDLITDEDANSAKEHNRLEILRDPSHIKALSLSQMRHLVSDADLTILNLSKGEENGLPTMEVLMDLEGWMKSTKTSEKSSNEIINAMIAELNGEIKAYKTGMYPTWNLKDEESTDVVSNKRILFRHMYAIFQATK